MTVRLRIGNLADATGVKVNTIRFYEDAGLLPEPARTPSGRRHYGDEDLKRLRFIKRARGLGFSLDEIRSLLQLSGDPEHDCAAVNRIALDHLRTVEAKVQSLMLLRDELGRIAKLCDGGRVSGCRVLEVLGGEAAP